jgi:hypothetical protein
LSKSGRRIILRAVPSTISPNIINSTQIEFCSNHPDFCRLTLIDPGLPGLGDMMIALRNALILCLALTSLVFAQRPTPNSAQTGRPVAAQNTPSAGAASTAEFVRENYSKYEYRIPMRDGVKLFTSVYIPKDVIDEGKTYPILLQRTPYNVAPYGIDKYRASVGPSELFAREKFIFVYQDVRGRFMSEGNFTIITPHKPAKGRKTPTKAPTVTTRSNG